MKLEIIINNQTDTPIYEQIESQIAHAIYSGRLQAGESLLSMRSMAKELKVSVITVQKAYENLQARGLICSRIGKGSVVALLEAEDMYAEARAGLKKKWKVLIDEAREMGMDLQKIQALFQEVIEEDFHE